MQIWDTAGQSRFRDITRIYYKGAHAVIICFDLSNFQSFLNVKFWLNEVLDISSSSSASQALSSADAKDRPFIFLIGTKKDMISNRDQENRLQKEAKELAEQIQAEFWMVSSASGDNVPELFHRVACLTFNRYMGNVAELARLELENTATQSVFYTSGTDQNGAPKVQLPDLSKKKSKKSKKSEHTETGLSESADLNGNSKKSRPNSGRSSSNRKAIVRMIHVPQEMIVKFVSNISEQVQSVLKLRKKKKKSNKVGEMSTMAGTPDSGVSDVSSSMEPKGQKPKRKTFRCFGYRCTFSVEQ